MPQQAKAVVDRFWNEDWKKEPEMLDENAVLHNFGAEG